MGNKRKWYFLPFLVLTLLLIASVVGCAESYTQENLDAAYETGHAEGYDDGYDKGYKTALAECKGTEVTEPSSTQPATLTKDELKVHFIDVGQGDSILVDLGETEILIDGGDKSSGVVEYLSGFVDGALELMVATHTPCRPHR